MSDLSHFNPTGRFSGLADTYARHRPDYPDAALDFILTHCGLRGGSLVADVGSGTGISTRQLAARGLRVVGIEPNAEMRKRAEAEPSSPGTIPLTYLDGRAEATGLEQESCHAVLAAQAFHWFATEEALRELRRVLKPEGWVVLLWNERDESDPFTAAYGAVVRSTPGAAAVEVPRGRARDVLLANSLFRNALRKDFTHGQWLDEAGVLGRAFSASYAPREPVQAERFAASLRLTFARFQSEGKVFLKYVTSVSVAQK